MPITFESFPKIPRFNSFPMTITEKIDGTNAQIIITEEGEFGCASRNRLITPEDDNYGFAAWAYENKENLMALGRGRHYGEWYGKGIQRGYGLEDRRFALFNTRRWTNDNPPPECCEVVPVLYHGEFDRATVEAHMLVLQLQGSFLVPDYMNPEGVCIFVKDGYMKRTFENDHKWKIKKEIEERLRAENIKEPSPVS